MKMSPQWGTTDLGEVKEAKKKITLLANHVLIGT